MTIDEFLAKLAAPPKSNLYRDDPNFIESYLDLVDARAFDCRRIDELHEFTAVVFKPDAVVSQSLGPALTWLQARGFQPVWWRPFTYDRSMVRNAWRYQINIATLERLRVVDLLLTGSESLYVLFRKPQTDASSASEELTALKGSAHVSERTADCLRTVLGDHNTFLNKVHIPDDTADLIREISIYFPFAERAPAFAVMMRDTEALHDLGGAVRAMEDRYPAESFEIDWVTQEMSKAVASSPLTARQKGDLASCIATCVETKALTGEAITLLDSHAQLFGRWDLLVFLTQFVQADRPGARKII